MDAVLPWCAGEELGTEAEDAAAGGEDEEKAGGEASRLRGAEQDPVCSIAGKQGGGERRRRRETQPIPTCAQVAPCRPNAATSTWNYSVTLKPVLWGLFCESMIVISRIYEKEKQV